MKTLKPEFSVNDVVTFCAYPDQLNQDLKCKVKRVEVDKEKGRILYHLTGSALSVTTGSCIKESVLFKPYKIAFDLINLYQLKFNLFKSDRLPDNIYMMKFSNSKMELLIRFDSNLVELFDTHGNVLQSINY